MNDPVATTDAAPAAGTLDYAQPVPLRDRVRLPPANKVAEIILVVCILASLGVLVVHSLNGPRRPNIVGSCASNLRWLGQSLHQYAADHGGAFPDTLQSLSAPDPQDGWPYLRDPRVLVCPSDIEGSLSTDPASLAADVAAGRPLSYVYLGRGLTARAPPDAVLAFEWPKHHDVRHGGRINVLYANGQVGTVTVQEARPLFDQLAAGARPIRLRQSDYPPDTTTRPTTRRTPDAILLEGCEQGKQRCPRNASVSPKCRERSTARKRAG